MRKHLSLSWLQKTNFHFEKCQWSRIHSFFLVLPVAYVFHEFRSPVNCFGGWTKSRILTAEKNYWKKIKWDLFCVLFCESMQLLRFLPEHFPDAEWLKEQLLLTPSQQMPKSISTKIMFEIIHNLEHFFWKKFVYFFLLNDFCLCCEVNKEVGRSTFSGNLSSSDKNPIKIRSLSLCL